MFFAINWSKKIKVLAPLFKSDVGESNMITFMCNTENTKY